MSVQRILENFGVQVKKDLQKSLAEKQRAKASRYSTPFNENSTLSNSIKYVTRDEGGSVVFELHMEGYGQIVDKGRKPGPVSEAGRKNIENWIKIKGINPSKFLSKPGHKPIPFKQAVTQFSFMVARKIRKKGYEANHFYTSIIKDGRLDLLKTQLSEEIKKDIIIEIHGIGDNNLPNA